MASPARGLIETFQRTFDKTPTIYRAPGRVNLIGEHTDYNLGFVLPIAIDLACYAAAAPNERGTLRVESLNLRERREWPISSLPGVEPAHDWTDYVIGVARQLDLQQGYDLLLESTVPIGAGLSSSAAIEVSTALGLGWRGELPSLELAKLCRRVENEFLGLPSGIMDQYISVFGHAQAAILVDCRSLESRRVSLPSEAVFVAVNSMVKHELGDSAYRQRVAECQAASRAIGVESLRDASLKDLEAIGGPVVRRRARHVITENARVLEFVTASESGDLERMGQLMTASHRSLRDDYEVSCEEIDFLVDAALEIPGVKGARITGGGFGGCTVNLMSPDAVERFEERLGAAYVDRFSKRAEFYPVQAADGAGRISG